MTESSKQGWDGMGLPTGEQIRDRLRESYDDIKNSLNISQLCLLLVQEGLLSAQDAYSVVTDADSLLKLIEEKGILGYARFYTCICKESAHMGHRYVQAILDGKVYATEEDIRRSQVAKTKLLGNIHVLACCDLTTLIVQMYGKELLTIQELKQLRGETEDTNRLLLHIIIILDTKGPLAYSQFVECLYHVNIAAYTELHEYACAEVVPMSLTGQHQTSSFQALPAPYNLPQLKLHGCLRGRHYNRIMSIFQECHHNGEWDRLKDETSKFLSPGSPQALRVVALLEMAVGWIFRNEEDKVLRLVAQAKELCKEVDGDNATFLAGRCEYILSRLYRYLQQYDRAHEHVQKATYILHTVEPGEDLAFVYYCDACILVERLSEHRSTKDFDRAKLSYEHAIFHARRHSSGLDLVAPHSFMRLAQMYLQSSHYAAGFQTNTESIDKAGSYLKGVDQSSLAQRSKCHYLLIESDLRRCQKDIENSQYCAQNALQIAQAYNFTVEIKSAAKRLDSFNAVHCH